MPNLDPRKARRRWAATPWCAGLLVCCVAAALCGIRWTQAADKEAADKKAAVVVIPPAAARPIDFHRDVLPILSQQCARCHTAGKHEGGLAIDDRARLLSGGDSGAALVVGHSEKSLLIELVAGSDPDLIMPAEGRRLTNDEIGILRAWIDQGLTWEPGLALTSFPLAKWEPRKVALPPDTPAADNPIDRLLAPYYARQKFTPPALVSDRVYARRVYLDLVGLPPLPEDISALEKDSTADKRPQLVRRLLASRRQYAIHWLSFWNDALRNDYKGPGYIDGGRKQITPWLYAALKQNKPYNEFVRELIAPTPDSEGFVKGIVWRGVVNASQRPEMQAAQNVSQVFLGINLKCASCHDSFVSQWKLNDAYAMASVFSEKPLEVHRCDAPTGKFVEPRFLLAKLGTIDPKAPRDERRRQLAQIITSPDDGRLARTIVNRLWARLMGRGLVEPVDAMDNPPWSADLLDFLATDLAEHGYDVQRTLELITTSRAYQLPSVGAPSAIQKDFVFRGPQIKRLSAEQFIDAVCRLNGNWHNSTMIPDDQKRPDRKKPNDKKKVGKSAPPEVAKTEEVKKGPSPDFSDVGNRAAVVLADPLARSLGRPGREQVVTNRESAATTLEVLELTNGITLDNLLKRGAADWRKRQPGDADELIAAIYRQALGRQPRTSENEVARGLLGSPVTPEGVQDFLWALVMLPDFQLIE